MFGFGRGRKIEQPKKQGSKWTPFSGSSRVKGLISDLKSDENAAMMPLIALSAVALVASAGIAVDAARAIYVKDILQRSVDAAGLAAGHALDPDDSLTDAQEFFDANFESAIGVANSGTMVVTPQGTNGFTISGTADLDATFMRIFGFESLSVDASAEIIRDTRGMELSLVLDNTGSMGFTVSGTDSTRRIDALIPAARSLINIVYGDNDVNPNLWVSVVPFVAAVNVGADQTNFLSAAGNQRIVDGDYSTAGWAGCIFARDNNLDQTDTPPTTQGLDPFYWPDTDLRDGFNNNNNWLGQRVVRINNNFFLADSIINEVNDPDVNFLVTAFFDGQVRSFFEADATGPNRGCGQEITPLIADRRIIIDQIEAMVPRSFGGTMTNLGLAWGWRTLSPDWRGLWRGGDDPDELPLDYSEPFMDKVIVLLTDGENSVGNRDLTSYGLADDLTSAPESLFSNGVDELDRRFLNTCTNAKNDGVIIYTIALSPDVPQATRDDLQNCASNPNFFFFASDSDSLNTAFDTIGRQLSALRLSQ